MVVLLLLQGKSWEAPCGAILQNADCEKLVAQQEAPGLRTIWCLLQSR